jgi:phage terminase large subunit-like protein
VLDRLMTWQGTRESPVELAQVEEYVGGVAEAYRAEIVFDPHQAWGTMQRLRSRGFRINEFVFSAQSVGRIASVLHRLLRDHMLALPDDPDLIDELANVRLRETSPGTVRMDHDADKHDDMAIALGMAAAHLLERPVHSGALATSGSDDPGGLRSALLGSIEALADRSGKVDPSVSYGMDF